MLYNIRQRSKGKMKIELAELMEDRAAAAANPKLAAYIFAGRSFTTATWLVATGSLAAGMGIACLMGVNNLKEFSGKMREYAQAVLPFLRRTDATSDARFDPDTVEFLREVAADLKREREEGPWRETGGHAIIGQGLRNTLWGKDKEPQR
ncbi:hypothetical protein HK104_000979 [Borealophlyctis nickersoniae]|nr:hypothetical protein HK104_000979 [Borealophlyctis nickersoniae]